MNDRPAQLTPEDLVTRLLTLIRGQFMGDLPPQTWHQQTHFLKRNVILWMARQMTAKGFTVPLERYEAIHRQIFQEIIHHNRAQVVPFWPGYLMKCVQSWWDHNWEAEYETAKSTRNVALTALASLKKAVPEDRRLEALATAHRLLQKRHRAKASKPTATQPTLL